MEKKVGETKILKKEHERILKNLSPPPTNVIFNILFCKPDLHPVLQTRVDSDSVLLCEIRGTAKKC